MISDELRFDLRDILILCNIIAMVGGAFYLVGQLKTEIRHLAEAITGLRDWLMKVQDQLNKTSSDVAVLKSKDGT